MKMTLFVLLLAIATTAFAAGGGGTTVGSGGDPIRRLFGDARDQVAKKISVLSPCSFSLPILNPIQQWIVDHLSELSHDIEFSKHLWVVDPQPTCGFTTHQPNSDIYLSYPQCTGTVRGLSDAMFVLVHESAHHLGVHDEVTADLIAQEVLNADPNIKCKTTSIMDSNVCSSGTFTTADAARRFSPGTTRATVGIDFQFYGRIARCVELTGCLPWKEWSFKPQVEVKGPYASWLFNLLKMRADFFALNKPSLFGGYLKFDFNGDLGPYPLSFTLGSDELFANEQQPARFIFWDQAQDVTHGARHPVSAISFNGKSYDGSNAVSIPMNKTASIKVQSDCLWSQWTQTNSYSEGIVEKIEIYFYGRVK